MRRLTFIVLLLSLIGTVAIAEAQSMAVQLAGPHLECRAGWDFAAGSMQVHFSTGRIVVPASQPVRFEVDHQCGSSRLIITLPSFVKNIRMNVAAGTFPAQVVGGGSVNPGLPSFTPVFVSGPTSNIEVRSTGNGRVVIEQISFELAEQPALFSFGATTTGRVLTHKYRSDDAYPSPLQTEDGKIQVEGLVHELTNATGIAGRKVYFRLIDPPDTADYVVRAGDAQIGDNADGPGTLNGASTASDTSDSDGKVSVTLEITDHAAGDNYQVEASFNENFNCSPDPCPKSIIYTAWKRVYVETHKMFRVGAFIRLPVTPGDKKIVVDSVTGFPAVPFKIRLIHASEVESATADFYSESVSIVAIHPLHDGSFELILPGQHDPAAPGVMHKYHSLEKVRGQDRPYLRDAVGVVTGNRRTDYFLTNAKLMLRPFEDAFVEYVWLSDSVSGVDDDLLPGQARISFDGVIPARATRIGENDQHEREWLTRQMASQRHASSAARAPLGAEPSGDVRCSPPPSDGHAGDARQGTDHGRGRF